MAMLLSIALLCVLGMMGSIVRWNGIVMLVLLAGFIVGSYLHDRRLCRLPTTTWSSTSPMRSRTTGG